MDIIVETKKRLNIAKKIASPLENIAKGVLLGGSMGFGQCYCISKKSDIDMVVVIDKPRLNKLESTWFFKRRTSKEVLDLFKENKINFFWVMKNIEDVEVNAFVYEKKAYVDFCLLKGNLRGFINHKPSEMQENYGFDGKKIKFNRNIIPYKKGFIYEKPALAQEKYWGGPPRQDFFYSWFKLYQEGNFLSDLERNVWKTTIKQLFKEYGRNPDLNKIKILNTHYTYQTARFKLSPRMVGEIEKRTEWELKQYKNEIKNKIKK